ncbi:MAG: hypothetical protein Q9196_005603 [Gyalolechia fulgens]
MREQCGYGILLGVECQHDAAIRKGLKITEILLYAATSRSPQQAYAPPSPPASSSPSPGGVIDNAASNIRLRALPLSSEILNVLKHAPVFQAPNSESANQDFYYLPSPSDPPPSAHEDITQARKRPKLETLFQDATQNRRLQKRRGGEGIAKFMAGDQTTTSALPSPAILSTTNQTEAKLPPPRKPLARSTTTGSLPSLPPPISSFTTTIPRPPSFRPTPTTLSTSHRKNSLLHTSSALSAFVDGAASPTLCLEIGGGGIEQANKTSLSRVIMAGMRMYGFEVRGRKGVGRLSSVENATPSAGGAGATTASASAVDEGGGRAADGGGAGRGVVTAPDLPTSTSASTASSINNNNNNDPDEYKKIYHQTYKAVAFVFRTHFSRKVLGQDVLRDTVDGFLGRFCRDPFAGGGEEWDDC